MVDCVKFFETSKHALHMNMDTSTLAAVSYVYGSVNHYAIMVIWQKYKHTKKRAQEKNRRCLNME